MAFSLAKRFQRFKMEAVHEFYLHIDDLLEHEDVQKLDNYVHHYCYTRLKHSLDVAYYSFFLAKAFGWDARSTARGGLLHDLFLYDWREEEYVGSHASAHPKVALQNAEQITDLTKVERNIILRHMWLATLTPPRYKEAYIVTFVDKYCAIKELFTSMAYVRPATAKAAKS